MVHVTLTPMIAGDAGDVALLNGALDDLVTVLGCEKISCLIARYLVEGDAAIEQIAQTFDAHDFAAARMIIHTFSGSSAMFGASALQHVLAGMETDLDQGRAISARAALPRLRLVWPRTRAVIAKHI